MQTFDYNISQSIFAINNAYTACFWGRQLIKYSQIINTDLTEDVAINTLAHIWPLTGTQAETDQIYWSCVSCHSM